MIFPEVKNLYKYQSYNINSVASLIHKVSWAAKPSTFNDPFDCAISLAPEIDKESMFDLILQEAQANGVKGYSKEKIEKFKQLFDEGSFDDLDFPERDQLCKKLSSRFSEMIQDIGVVSLSEVYDHILMWSHYADQHKGFCVEFERNQDGLLGTNSTLPVRYTEKLPIFSLQNIAKNDADDRKHYIRSLVLSKAFEWSYEREWRYLYRNGNCVVDLKSDVSAIIFGARMPEEQKATLVEIVNKYYDSVKFKQVKLKENGFGLDIVKYSPVDIEQSKLSKNRKFEHLLDFDL